MPRRERKTSDYGKPSQQRANLIVIALVLAVLAVGIVLLVRGMSFGGDAL